VDNETLFPCSASPTPEEKKKEQKKPRLRKIDRRQMVLHPVEIEHLIPEDHEARAIWEIVGSLDLSCYYDQVDAREGAAGAPAFDPRLLVSIWIYSYSRSINSSREIARLTEYDPAYQWLTGMRPLNYHTLADFRSSCGESLARLYAQVLAILSFEGIITMERVMHDGTKIKALAADRTFRREKTLRKLLVEAEAHIKAMEETSEEEMSLRRKKARERALHERKERLSNALDEIKKITPRATEARASSTDPESRIMKQPGGSYAPSYNLQLSTDAHKKAIIALSLSPSANDQVLLPHALKVLEETMGTLPNQLVVDQGFTSRANVLMADEKGIDLIGPMRESSSGKAVALNICGITEGFSPDKFLFDPERNGMICPQGKLLVFRFTRLQKGKTVYNYQGKECAACPSKPSCSPTSKRGRMVCRIENDPEITAFLEKMNTPEAKAVYKQRAEVAEFPNLWIKEKLGLRRFRLKGLQKAEMEARWACLTYNIKLWIRLCWKPRLMSTIG
jgi:transposase